MFGPEEALLEDTEGFVGAVAGMTLSDIIQMNAHNRFSGCITVMYGQKTGAIFFREGEIIHSEQEGETGEQAFYAIMQWPGGKFNLEPKISTTSITIHESWKFLLMESCRIIDENRHRTRQQQQPQSGAVAEVNSMSASVSEKLTQIPGVNNSVLFSKDGTPVNNSSFEAENLAAQALYLAMTGDHLGNIFGVGEVKVAALQGKSGQMLLFESKLHYLAVTVSNDQQLGAVEAEIRKALAPKK